MLTQGMQRLAPGLENRAGHSPINKSQDSYSVTQKKFNLELAILRALDIIFGLALLFFLLPIIGLIILTAALTDRGPIFFTQNRVGAKGAFFACHKFRSMKPNSAHLLNTYLEQNPSERERYRVYLKVSNDPRITPLGSLIRKTSLDEVPQIFNVIKGDMSLVGPRPILPDEIKKYGSSLRLYRSVRPGITGLWQVMGRNKLSYRRRVALDRIYVRKRSIGLYMYILMLTIPAVLLQQGSL